MNNVKYKIVEGPGFCIDPNRVLKLGIQFDFDELPLYENKSSEEIAKEYWELLKVGEVDAAIRAYILRSFIVNKRGRDEGMILDVEGKVVMDDNAINENFTLEALEEYRKDFDKKDEGGTFTSITGVEEEPGEG